MIDRRGDGQTTPDADETENEFKAHYAWHGRLQSFYPSFPYANDNVGGPILVPDTFGGYLSSADTSGRLGAFHFVGKVHLHADTSPSDKTNDANQPITMDEFGSDDRFNSQNDPFNTSRMLSEYQKMTVGKTQRHAYAVEPSGFTGFVKPNSDPSFGTSGGFNAATGYGPYSLAIGESITIVYAEAVSGIGHEFARVVGSEYKQNIRSGMDSNNAREIKNTKMFQGRDSLFQTFRRAIANYNSNYKLKQAPIAPSYFEVQSKTTSIELSWDFDSSKEAEIEGFEIYRSAYSLDSLAVKIATLSSKERMYVDNPSDETQLFKPELNIPYYYFIQSVGLENVVADEALTPNVKLRSSRYYTQTYDPVKVLFNTSTKFDDSSELVSKISLQNYPNPFNPSTEIQFSLPESMSVILEVYNSLGQRVSVLLDKNCPQGVTKVTFNTDELPSGLYMYKLSGNSFSKVEKMMLIK